MPKSANELYRESGTTKSFKDWINEEKSKGVFIYNKHLNNKIDQMNKQFMFHQADGTSTETSTTANATQSNAPKSVTSQTKRDIKFLVLGAAVSLAVVISINIIRKRA